MKNIILSFIGIIFFMAMITGCTAQPKAGSSFTLASGTPGGTWNPLGTELKKMIEQYLPDTKVSVQETAGALENLKLIATGKVDLTFAYDYQIVRLNEGKLPQVGDGKKPVRILMGIYEQPLQIITRKDSGITGLMELKGKRVSTGSVGSGTDELSGYVLQALGIDADKDLTRTQLSLADAAAALKAGKLDAFFWSGAIPTPAIADLARDTNMQMVVLPIDQETADKVMLQNPGVFHNTLILDGDYAGMHGIVTTLAITAVLCAQDSFPAEKVTQILDVVFSHRQDLATIWKDAEKLNPGVSITLPSAEALAYLEPAAAMFFVAKMHEPENQKELGQLWIRTCSEAGYELQACVEELAGMQP